MEKLMSKKVLMGAGLVLVAYLVYKAYAKKQADKVIADKAIADKALADKALADAEALKVQQSAKPAR
jgi:uncharacterized membrane protein YebE (DUF533 family)